MCYLRIRFGVRRALTVVCSVDVRRVPQRVGRGVRSITLHSVPDIRTVLLYKTSQTRQELVIELAIIANIYITH